MNQERDIEKLIEVISRHVRKALSKPKNASKPNWELMGLEDIGRLIEEESTEFELARVFEPRTREMSEAADLLAVLGMYVQKLESMGVS